MANTVIALKKSGTPSSIPAALSNGEIALNYADGILYYKHANGSIASISGGGSGNTISFGTVNAAGTLLIADAVNDVLDIRAGQNIIITGDAINDRMTIDANLAPVFDRLNAAVTVSNVAPASPSAEDLWWNSDIGAMFVYYSDGDSSQWVEIASGGGSGGGGGAAALARSTLYANTATLANDGSENVTITGYKSYVLASITANNSAWIRVYTDSASRTSDASRSIGVDPVAGSGVIAEVVTSGSQTVNITPFVVGGNLDNPVTSNVYLTITNKSGSSLPIGINMTVIGLES